MLGYHRQARILGARRRYVNEIVVCRSLSSAHNTLMRRRRAQPAPGLVGQPPVSQAVSLFLMKILVIGGGAREHAMAWKLSRERSVTAVFCAPGNPGIASVARCLDADVGDPLELLDVARSQAIDLTVVGPELPLSRGIVDVFTADGRAIVGPYAGRRGARVEQGVRQGLHGASSRADRGATTCAIRRARRSAWLEGDRFGYPLVLKADGLAAGKGVVIVDDRAAAAAAVQSLMVERRFGSAGDRIVFEEFLVGQEASYFVLADGTSFIALGSAQDHKRIFDDDRGPNTGGMGAFAPSPLVTSEVERRVVDEIVWPVLDGMQHEGHPYRGFLYVGLMLTADGPKVVEFNVRLGDPETQVVLPMLDEELSWLLGEAAMGALALEGCALSPRRAMSESCSLREVIPKRLKPGQPITGIDPAAVGARRARIPRGNQQARRSTRHLWWARADRRRARAEFQRGDRHGVPRRLAHSFRRDAVPPRHRPQGVGSGSHLIIKCPHQMTPDPYSCEVLDHHLRLSRQSGRLVCDRARSPRAGCGRNDAAGRGARRREYVLCHGRGGSGCSSDRPTNRAR